MLSQKYTVAYAMTASNIYIKLKCQSEDKESNIMEQLVTT